MPKLTYLQKIQKKESAHLRKVKRQQASEEKKRERAKIREEKVVARRSQKPLLRKSRAKAKSHRKDKRIARKIWHKLI